MANKIRKLFPDETTTTNQTQAQDCYGLCDPACPYNCYPNQDYFSPPPPSILRDPTQVDHIPSYLIIIGTVFMVFFLCMSFYVIKMKCYAEWFGWRFNGYIASHSGTTADREFRNQNQVDHPVWLIATVGLQQSVINSITVWKYKRNEGLVEGTECSVCLNEFQEEEALRLLPKCNHAFHVPCIDTWLRSHTNCPLCRASIVSSSVSSEAPVSNSEQENASSARNQETIMENPRNEGVLSSNMVAGESSEVLGLVDEANSKDRVHDQTLNHHVVDFEIHTEMGSVSATESGSHRVGYDHKHVETHLQRVTQRKQEQDGYYCQKTCKTMRRFSSIEECLHLSPVSMKRSFSSNGRILSSRGCMALNAMLHASLLESSVR